MGGTVATPFAEHHPDRLAGLILGGTAAITAPTSEAKYAAQAAVYLMHEGRG
jgi:pimeloyl-ACP methyl ester carboxylesterase